MTFADFEDEGSTDSIHALGDALRQVQSRVAATSAPQAIARQAAALLQEASTLLEPYRYIADRDRSWDDIKRARGSRTLNPVMTDVAWVDDHLHGRVTFSAFYLGGNGAVHGGALPSFYDEVLGRVANHGRPICRTASLKVDYRSVTLIDRDLRVEAHLERVEGRKRYAYAAMFDGEVLTCEAHGLFIELRDGAA
ncbi:MAG: PaaI family thioesterase [Candidatus Nanopelagicales bacterium]|nr:PaaI family thioesterase [Candidatus Nanopelagicales bacterium]